MDFFKPYLLLPLVVLIIVGAIWLSVYLNSSTMRGKLGEGKVRRVIGSTVAKKQYVINDLILAHGEMTSQIDHVVINSRGIFVIETKNYSGRIYGTESQREWTQVLAYGKVKNKLYNPLKQNATHIYNVKRLVGNLPVHSLIVFVQNNTERIEAKNVISLSCLKRALGSGTNVLSVEQMETAYAALTENKQEISTEQHVQNIKVQQHNLACGICPRCGGKLVLRSGKYGNFWGCEKYPKCKFIKK